MKRSWLKWLLTSLVFVLLVWNGACKVGVPVRVPESEPETAIRAHPSGGDGDYNVPGETPVRLGNGVFSTKATAAPVAIIGSTLLYYDLRVRKEGYSLEALAGELGVDPGRDVA